MKKYVLFTLMVLVVLAMASAVYADPAIILQDRMATTQDPCVNIIELSGCTIVIANNDPEVATALCQGQYDTELCPTGKAVKLNHDTTGRYCRLGSQLTTENCSARSLRSVDVIWETIASPRFLFFTGASIASIIVAGLANPLS